MAQALKPKDKLKITKDGIEYEFEVAEEGGYIASVPELPGCVSEGDTFEEALAMIQDALRGWLHVAAKHGDPIPPKFKPFVRNRHTRRNG
jgi:predicted RNase H-like HicB family nuclease